MGTNETQIPKKRREVLEKRLQSLRSRLRSRSIISRMSLIGGISIIIVTPILYIATKDEAVLVGIIIGLIFALAPHMQPSRPLILETQDIENELDLLSIADASIEQRAEKLFKLHQIELKKYYDQTLRQGNLIFIVGIACIVIGFAIIGITLYFITSSPPNGQLSEKIVLGSVGAVGAVLSNFIAVIYLKMYTETIRSLTEFHSRLVVTHHLHFGNFLTSKIIDKTLREKTLSEIALNLAKQ